MLDALEHMLSRGGRARYGLRTRHGCRARYGLRARYGYRVSAYGEQVVVFAKPLPRPTRMALRAAIQKTHGRGHFFRVRSSVNKPLQDRGVRGTFRDTAEPPFRASELRSAYILD